MKEPIPKISTGFTLIEVMISIALALILILGINQVFSLTSKTIAAGQAYSEVNRNARSFESVIATDAQGSAVSDGPGFIIRSEQTLAYRSLEEQNAGLPQARYRTDRLAMFARGLFPTQVGSSGGYIDMVKTIDGRSVPVSSREAWIVYEHLRLPSGTATPPAASSFYNPGDTTTANTGNRYALQWVLGRSVNLLLENPPTSGYIPNGTGLAPLATQSLYNSTYDVAQTSLNDFSRKLADPANSAGGFGWAQTLSDLRFRGNPSPGRPLDSAAAALTVPCFLTGCTSFIVEYAGDFITQDPGTGAVTQNQPDGVTDFMVSTNNQRKIRWFGFPRDVNGDGNINANTDVVPFRDFIGGPAAFEHFSNGFPPSGSYTTIPSGAFYTCGWSALEGGPRPTMVRITLTLDDPSGRITNGGQTFEYVLKLN